MSAPDEELALPTKDKLGAYDAIETAKPGEFLFPLQAGDPFAPATVLHWVKLCREAGMAEENEKRADAILRKATDAEQVAWAMKAYQRGDGPVEEGKRATYNELPELPTTEERVERTAMIRGVAVLSDAASRLIVFAETLELYPTQADTAIELRRIIGQVQQIATAIEPRRDNERT